MFKKEKRYKLQVESSKTLLWLVVYCLIPMASSAQCAMCRASLQGDSNQEQAAAVNDGIVFLMAIPYILVAGIGYYIYRMYTKKK